MDNTVLSWHSNLLLLFIIQQNQHELYISLDSTKQIGFLGY